MVRKIDENRLSEYHLCSTCGYYEIPNTLTTHSNGFNGKKLTNGECVKCKGETFPATNFGGMLQSLFRKVDKLETRLHKMEHTKNKEEYRYLTPEEEN